eukprot:XP_766208.1 coatomer beta subunit [Theileria parva strain Muguga]
MESQESELYCPIYLDIDMSFEGTLSSVKKNLENNSLSKKTKAMEDILLMHLRGMDVSSLFMDIIRFAVPSTDHRMKRLVYLFFQTFNMCKKDGTPRDEVILVCNGLRNDLCSPNEYVRGSVLRLLSNLTIFNIIQPLIPSIISNVEHREPYVYRNALLCLTNISERFGSDLVTSSFKTVENFITSCDDVFGTVRAYKLLESCNLDLCIQFILAIESNLLSLSPLIHLSILGSFEKLSSVNDQIAQMMMRILTLLLQFSNNNSVLFYSSNLLLKYNHQLTNMEDLGICCKCLIKVLLNESDLNVKMLVLDKLRMIHRSSQNILENFVNDLLKGLSVTNLMITRKILSLVLSVCNKSNINTILENLLRNFVKELNYSCDIITQYRSTLLQCLFQLTHSFAPQLLSVFTDLLPFLNSTEVISTQISLLLYHTIRGFTRGNIRNIGGNTVENSVEKVLSELVIAVDGIKYKEVLINCLYIIGEYSTQFSFINKCYQILTESPVETAAADAAAGVVSVILEDGSYSSKYSNKEHSDGFNKLLLHHKDILLYNTLSTTILKLIHKLTLDEEMVRYVSRSCVIVIRLMELLDNNVYHTKRLKMVLTLLLGLLKDTQKYTKLVQTYLILTCQPFNTHSEDRSNCDKFDVEMCLNDFFPTQQKEQEDEELKLLNDLSNYHKIHQFTSLTDPLYVEGYIKLIGNKLYFNMLIENKSTEVLQNITLDLSTGTHMQLATSRKLITLSPRQQVKTQVKFRIDSSTDETVYGYVYYSTSSTILLQCLSFNPIHISLYDFIQRNKISGAQFRTFWNDFQWENVIKLCDVRVTPTQLLNSLLNYTHMSIITDDTEFGISTDLSTEEERVEEDLGEIGMKLLNESFLSINLFLKTIFDEEAIANLSLVKRPNNTYSGCFRIRSREQVSHTHLPILTILLY